MSARCVAPIYTHRPGCSCAATPGWTYGDPCQAWDDAPRSHESTCGDDATTERTIEGVACPLCDEHASEIDADEAEAAQVRLETALATCDALPTHLGASATDEDRAAWARVERFAGALDAAITAGIQASVAEVAT